MLFKDICFKFNGIGRFKEKDWKIYIPWKYYFQKAGWATLMSNNVDSSARKITTYKKTYYDKRTNLQEGLTLITYTSSSRISKTHEIKIDSAENRNRYIHHNSCRYQHLPFGSRKSSQEIRKAGISKWCHLFGLIRTQNSHAQFFKLLVEW